MADGRTKRPKGKKGPTAGSGGNNRRRLEGKGPTPKAEDRVYHPAHKCKLASEAAARQEQAKRARANWLRPGLALAPGHELIAGRNPVLEAVRSGIPLTRVFVSGGVASDERLGEVVRTATALGAPLFEASRSELGAVMRSASAFGADGVLVPERRSVGVNATVWKVSAGAAARVPAAQVVNLVAALGKLKKEGYFVVGLDGGGDTMVEDIGFADAPLVLVTGSEGKGLARLTRETCDAIASIPIAAELESLNAAVATGIALYQIDRLRARSQ